MMQARWIVVLAAVGASMAARSANAQPVEGTCTITSMRQDSLTPSIPFPVPVNGEQIPVTIDASSGAITFDFGALPVFSFPNGFSQDSGLDTIDFLDGVVTGTIDSGGNVFLPGIRGINCTQGNCPTGSPCPCVPGNVCSNDVSRVCVPGGTGELGCDPGGVCQGVCSNDRTRTCATSLDCLPPGFCGEGVAMRFRPDLTTGTSRFESFTVTGSADSVFVDGAIRLVDVSPTPPETFAIGSAGVSSFQLGCTLSPVPNGDLLPAPPSWAVRKGTVKLARDGAPGAADDTLRLSGTFLPLAGEADFAAEDLIVTLAAGDTMVASLTIPAGSLVANKKGTKLKLRDKTGAVVEVNPPPPPGSTPSHRIAIKRKKTGEHALAISSKNLVLDALDAAEVTTGIIYGFQTPTDTSAVKAKGSKLVF